MVGGNKPAVGGNMAVNGGNQTVPSGNTWPSTDCWQILSQDHAIGVTVNCLNLHEP